MEIENGFAIVEMTVKVVVAANSNSSDETQSIVKWCAPQLDTTETTQEWLSQRTSGRCRGMSISQMEESYASMVSVECSYQGVPS